MSNTTAAAVLAAINALPHTKLKETRNKAVDPKYARYSTYSCNSPLRATADSGTFLLSISPDGEYGTYNDITGGKKGTLYELADELNVPRAERTANDASGYANLSEYAAAHGAPVDAFILAGWTETTYKIGKNTIPALLITTASGPRKRILHPDPKTKPKFMNASTYQSCWYGLEDALQIADGRGVPLVLVNGEASVVACQYHGVAAACITLGSERALPANLLQELQNAYKQRTVVIALDCDTKGRTASATLSAQLKDAGYEPRVVDLKLANKQDAADYLRLHTADELYALPDIAELVIAENDAFLLSAIRSPDAIYEAIAAGEEKDGRAIVSHSSGAALLWVGAHLLGARPKTYKSMLALHIANTVHAGTRLFDDYRFTATRGSVLYLDFEMKTSTVKTRMQMMNVQGVDYVTASMWRQQRKMRPFVDPTALAHDVIRAWCRSEQRSGRTPALVVVDTMSAIMNATYEKNTDTHTVDYQYYSEWDALAGETDTAILLLTHLTKGTRGQNGADPADAIYGSGKIQGAVESIITLTRQNADDAFVTMQCRTRDNGLEPIVLQFDAARGHHYIPSSVPLASLDLSKTKARVLEALEAGERTPDDIARVTAIAKKSVDKALSQLVQEDLAARTARGEYSSVRAF
jgi:5S rRNA maturation endonuclease (ribonuclease M5)